MRFVKTLRFGMILSLVALVIGTGPGLAAPASQDAVWVITSPAEGSVISGVVTIQGTATHPNFASYGILYAAGSHVAADTGWRMDDPIAWDVKSMVVNGVLGTWDTTTVPNGQYILALVVYEAGNDTPNVHFVNNLTVQNEEATPTPEPTLAPTPTEQPANVAPPGEVESPVAPTIEQPPTATPRPTPTLSPVTPGDGPGTAGEETPKAIISIDSVKETFVAGAKLAILAYVLGGLYVAVKAAVRYFLRAQRRNERP